MKISVTIGLSQELKDFISELMGKEVSPAKLINLKSQVAAAETGAAIETPVKKKKVKEDNPLDMTDLLGDTTPKEEKKKATTIEDVRAKLKPVMDSGKEGFAKVQTGLKAVGAESLVKLSADKYDDLIKAVLG